jgi:hypothetical protein
LDEQIALLKAENRPELEWAWLRKVNLSAQVEALKLCRDKAAELRSAVLYEKLGDLQQGEDAARAYQQALEHTADTTVIARLSEKRERALAKPPKNE